MISYRRSLEQIGVPRDARVAYSDFYCKPKSLSQAMEAMQPAGEFNQVIDISLDEDWTDAIQGCATDGAFWYFASNPERKVLTAARAEEKRLYVFRAGTSLRDEDIVVQPFCFSEISIPGGVEHVGQLDVFEDKIYVSHFNAIGSHIIVLRNNDGAIVFDGLITIGGPAGTKPESPTDRRVDKVQFQCIVPWDRTFLTCFGAGTIDVLFVHDLDTGEWTNRTINLQTPIPSSWWVQGAAFSDYGHLFIAVSPKGGVNTGETQPVHVVSPLNGRELSVISVCAEGLLQELEGCCFRPMSLPDGRPAELHVVILDNKQPAKDNLFFKSFRRTRPAE